MFPIGGDSFGLPAENAAIKHSIHPHDWTEKNTTEYKKLTEKFGAAQKTFGKKVGKDIGKAAKDVGNAAKDFGKDMEKAGKKLGKDLKKLFD